MRGIQFGFDPLGVFDDSGYEPFLDEPQYLLVGDTVQEFEHPVVVDCNIIYSAQEYTLPQHLKFREGSHHAEKVGSTCCTLVVGNVVSG